MPAATSIEADLVTHNKSIGAPLHCNRLYGYGLRCGVSIAATHPSSLVQSEQVPPQISKTKGFVGGVPVNTETSASEILRVRRSTKRGSGVRSFLSCVARGSNQGLCVTFRGHRSRAGCLSANQGMPVQIRLTAPISKTRRAPACAAESPKLRGLGAAPRRRATYNGPLD